MKGEGITEGNGRIINISRRVAFSDHGKYFTASVSHYSFQRRGARMCGKGSVYHLEMAELWMCSSPAFAFRGSR